MTSRPLGWAMAWRIARRDLSLRFRGLRLLLVCLFLGTGALAAIGSLTAGIEHELAARGRVILGGDIEATIWQRQPNSAELAAFAALGATSRGTRLQAMATAGKLAVPIELKAVDDAWPLTGQFTLADGHKAGAPPRGTVWLARGAAERLGVATGDRLAIGGQDLLVGGIIAHEPDRLSEGFSLGPVVIANANLPQAAGLLAPGAMFRSKTRIALPAGQSPQAAVTALEKQFPDSGFTFRTRDKASPGAERFVSRMGDFLVLTGLAALVVAGLGIGGGVASFLEARRTNIATLKVLGATGDDIRRIYILQIGAAALVGSLAGIVAGTAATPLAARALDGLLPIGNGIAIDTAALLRALAYGLLVTMVFAAPPLARTRAVPAMALMRASVSPAPGGLSAAMPPVLLGLVAIVVLALASSSQASLTLAFLGGAAAMLALLGALGRSAVWLAAHLPRPRHPMLRAGIANLYRPGARTGSLVTALGFGLASFVLLAALQTSLDANVRKRIPAKAPDYFALDVPRDSEARFRAVIASELPGAQVRTVPALRGRILAYGSEGAMIRNAKGNEGDESGPWQLRGERGLTYAEYLPEGSSITQGKWWPLNYQGEPLVSVDVELAEPLGLKIGDQLTVGVLGIERTARIASFRRIDWATMGFNYVLVFSPNALRDAPHNLAATIDAPPGPQRKGLLQRLALEFPSTSVIETGGLLDDGHRLLTQVSTAILAAASVTVLAGLAVLAGTIAAARASRLYDSVILRVLGASKGQLLLLLLAEYGLLALLLSFISLAMGGAGAWAICVKLFEFTWMPNWPVVMLTLFAGLALILGMALAAFWPLLRTRPARVLREL